MAGLRPVGCTGRSALAFTASGPVDCMGLGLCGLKRSILEGSIWRADLGWSCLLLCTSCSFPCGFHIGLLKHNLRPRTVHVGGRHDVVRHPGLLYPCLLHGLSLGDAPHLLGDCRGIPSAWLPDGLLILMDPLQHGRVGLLIWCNVHITIPLSAPARIVVDHRVAYHRRGMVIVDNGSAADVRHPDVSVVVRAVEVCSDRL